MKVAHGMHPELPPTDDDPSLPVATYRPWPTTKPIHGPLMPEPWYAPPTESSSRPIPPSPGRRARIVHLRGAGAPSPVRWIAGLLLVALALSLAGASIGGGLAYSDMRSALDTGLQQLAQVEQLGKQVANAPFDTTLLLELRAEVAAAEQDFQRAQRDFTFFAPAHIVPGLDTKFTDAQALLTMAVALTGGGREVLDAAIPVVTGLRTALAATASATPTAAHQPAPTPVPTTTPAATTQLTAAQLATLKQALQDCAAVLAQANAARSHIHDNGASLGASATHALARYDSLVPSLRQMLTDGTTLMASAPALLGINHPTSYLVEILDETELRGGGGFMGNYGIITVANGHVAHVSVTDSYLLDQPYLAKHARAFPANYSWFKLAPSMGLRDSNLAPDFPYNAQLAEQIYTQESGQTVAGVVAITPAFIAQILGITGPVEVPGYNVTVNSQNLVATIHYYQGLTNDQGVPSSDGTSSTRKRFTAILGDTVFGRLRTLPQKDLPKVLKLVTNSLKSKDLQVYVNDTTAEALLQRAHLANTLTPPPATPGTPSPDLLAVVDNDVGGNKAFLFVSEAISDVVAVQQNGTIQHTLTLRYSYRPTGNTHGSKTFSDEVQVFAPPGSVLIRRSGLSQLDATGTAYGRVVFGGRISMAPFTVRTVTFVWQAPAPKPPTGATAGGHAYRLLVTRQAGSVASFAVTIQLPSPANTVKGAAPLKQGKGSVSYQTSGALLSDLDLQVTWA